MRITYFILNFSGPTKGNVSSYSRTPIYGSQTPMYGAGSRTPMYGSQTPQYEGMF